MESRGGSYIVTTDTDSMYRVDAKDADALGLSAPSAAQFLSSGPLTEQTVIDQLKQSSIPKYQSTSWISDSFIPAELRPGKTEGTESTSRWR